MSERKVAVPVAGRARRKTLRTEVLRVGWIVPTNEDEGRIASTSFTLGAKLYARLKAVSRARNNSINDAVLHIIRWGLQQQEALGVSRFGQHVSEPDEGELDTCGLRIGEVLKQRLDAAVRGTGLNRNEWLLSVIREAVQVMEAGGDSPRRKPKK